MEALNRQALGLVPWFVVSWLLTVGVALLLWFSPSWGKMGRALQRFWEQRAWLATPGEILTALHALGLPYAALLTGFLSLQTMGLAGFSWWETLGQGAALGTGLLLLAWWAWRSYLRALVPPATLLERPRRLLATPAGGLLLLAEAAAHELHWAFYRALPMLLWGPWAGLWVGLFLAVAERYACPQTTSRLRQAGGLEEEAWWLARIVAMTAIFAVLRNLWVCIALHALLQAWVAWLVQRRAAAPAAPWARPAPATAAVPPLAVGAVLVVLALGTWQAARPALLPPRPAAPPTAAFPTTTPTATPWPATVTPTPSPRPTTTPQPTPLLTYTVQPGDTLRDIAAALGVPVEELMRVNGLEDSASLEEGQVLIIP